MLKFLAEHLIDKRLYVKLSVSDNSTTAKTSPPLLHNSNLLSSVLLCIGEVCLKLKSSSLVYLNKVMTFALAIVDIVRAKLGNRDNAADSTLVTEFKTSSTTSSSHSSFLTAFKQHELLMLSCVTCLLKIVQNMANFLSPYLQRLVHVSCSFSYLIQLSSAATASGSSQPLLSPTSSQIELKLGQLRSTLATCIPLRLLAPIFAELSAGVGTATTSDAKAMRLKHVEFYMQIARLAIQSAGQEDIVANIRTLRSIFMHLFDMRVNFEQENGRTTTTKSTTKSSALDTFVTDELSRYENHVIGVFCEMTFKLSEDLFRPIFFKMYEWACVNEPPKERQITFYRAAFRLVTWSSKILKFNRLQRNSYFVALCKSRLSDKLKNLFVLFASQFVPNASQLLNLLNSSKTSIIKKYIACYVCVAFTKLVMFVLYL